VLIAGWVGVVIYAGWRLWSQRIADGYTLVYEVDVDHPFERDLRPSEVVKRAAEALRVRVDPLTDTADLTVKGKRLELKLPRRINQALVKSILARPARLEFKIVDENSDFMTRLGGRLVEADPKHQWAARTERDGWAEKATDVQHRDVFLSAMSEEELKRVLRSLEAKPPDDHELAFEEERPHFWRTYYLFRRAEIANADIDDAEVNWDPQTGRPEVSLTFSKAAAERFAELTEHNVGHKLAILLDGRIQSAPVIESRINGGRARISLGGQSKPEELRDEARDLVAVLRLGSFPAPIRLVEER
jgi:preprotein translocase subunit SecD